MTIAGGFAAGILGFTGLGGILFYLILYFATSLLILFGMKTTNVSKYLPKTSLFSFLHGGIMNEALAFVLYWTLMYALVHIY